MIAYLKGKIKIKSENFVILEVGGVGYKIFSVPEILEAKLQEEVEVYTHMKVSETEQSLFGMPNFETLKFFEKLITVSGVGPKSALAIVSSGSLAEISSAIGAGDSALFRKISGIGAKTAEKIILELRGKVEVVVSGSSQNEVFDALVALGYKQSEVRSVLGKLDKSLDTNQQIKTALKMLG